MKTSAIIVLGLLCSIAFLAPARGQEEEEEVDFEGEAATPQEAYNYGVRPSHPLTDLAPSHKDVTTVFQFTKHAEKLPLGEAITVLCGFNNGAAVPMNVSGIMGSLNVAQQFDMYLYNFTARAINYTVGPGQEVAFQYRLMVDPAIEPIDYRLALTIFYEDDTDVYTSTFFNDTRTFYDPPTELDTRKLFSYVLGIAIMVLAGVLFTRATSSNKGGHTSVDDFEDFGADNDHMSTAKPTSGRGTRRRRN